MLNSAPQWQRIKDLSLQMQAQLQAGDWSALPALQQQQQEMLEAFFARPCLVGETEQRAEDILQILALNRQMVDSLQETQQEMAAAFQKFLSAKPAMNAYRQVSHHK